MSGGWTIGVEPEDGRRVLISAGPGVLSAVLADHGYPLNTRCGQRGLCHGCEVVLKAGELGMEGAAVGAPALVRACRARVCGPVEVAIPQRSRIGHKAQVGETFEVAVPWDHDPVFPVEGGRDTGFVVDLGTTTVVVMLVDLASGEVLARAGGFNGQIRFGDNVLTRIDAARVPVAVEEMREAVVGETLVPLLCEACGKAGRELRRIAGGMIAGNTTMLHLLVGEDPSPLGVAPFTARFLEGRRVEAGAVGMEAEGLAADTPVWLLPSMAAYIGADITAGVYATGMMYDEGPSLLVDMGTNGEIVLQHEGTLTACATAAGPAFEGCGLSCGTRARDGAVSGVKIGSGPFGIGLEIIGNGKARGAAGVCGSAYIDFLAEARRCGLLGAAGRFVGEIWPVLPESFRWEEDGQRAVLLAGEGSPRISEVDVALLLQAKAAIGAGIETLLESAGIRAEDLTRVYLAGGFGMHIDVRNAIRIGLLPGCEVERVRLVGNTSLAGAMLAMVDRSALPAMEELRGRVRVVELNLADGFEDRYIEHLSLP